jgi:hypothetical protein
MVFATAERPGSSVLVFASRIQEYMEESQFKVGDFVRYKPGTKEITYLILDAGTKKPNHYKIEAANGRCLDVAFKKISPLKDLSHRDEWINSRIQHLQSAEKIGELAVHHLKLLGLDRERLISVREGLIRKSVFPDNINSLIINFDEAISIALAQGSKIKRDEDATFISLVNEQEQTPTETVSAEVKKVEVVAEPKEQTEKKRNLKPKEIVEPPQDKEHGLPNAVEKSCLPNDADIVLEPTMSIEHYENTDQVSDAIFEDISFEPSTTNGSKHVSVQSPVEVAKTPHQLTAKGLVNEWENLPAESSEEKRHELAEQMRQLLDPPLELSEEAKEITGLLDLSDTEPDMPHPLFWMLSGSASPMQRRQLIARLDLSTLECYVKWLVDRGSAPISQLEGLLDGLADQHSRTFQAATREGGVDHYQRIVKSMNLLLPLLDAEARGPYEWRLFSFLREGWARTAPHAQANNNDLIGARDYLNWLLGEAWPKSIWPALLTSLMRDEALDRLNTDTQQQVLKCAAVYALSTPQEERKPRLLHFQEVLTLDTLIKFLKEVSKEADKKR